MIDGTKITLPETNIAPENGWLEDYFPFEKAYFQVLCYFQGGYTNVQGENIYFHGFILQISPC